MLQPLLATPELTRPPPSTTSLPGLPTGAAASGSQERWQRRATATWRTGDLAAPVGNPGREVVDGGGLVSSGQPTLVVLALVGVVGLDVSHMVPGKLVNGCLNGLDAPLDPHGLCGEVGVSSSSVPVTSHRLGVERHHNTEVLCHPLEEVSADPEVVAHVDSLCGANLVLPLGRHHLGVGSRHPDPGIEASSVVSLNNVSSIDIAGADSAIVRALRSGEAVLGPAEGMTVLV